MPTVLLAGGGTGGHIFPGIAIARELNERVVGCEIIFVGTQAGLESRIVPASGFRLLTIRSSGLIGVSLVARAKGVALIPVSLLQSIALVRRTKPRLVIGVGGFASGPVMAAAVLLRVPTLICEQNCIPGATNRWMAPFVTQAVVTFPETKERLGGRGVVLGNPVRKEFTLIGPRRMHDGARRILICGGSRGARAINRAVCDALPHLAPLAGTVAVTHQTGDADRDMVRDAWSRSGFPGKDVEVRPFIADMARVYEESDLIVSRAGATTVAELTAAGRPSVLIPFAAAAHDHQTFNARALVAVGAAEMIAEQDLTGEVLAGTIRTLLSDEERLARMAAAARTLGRPDAAARIADLCVAMMGGEAA